jgi:hypothetical protein
VAGGDALHQLVLRLDAFALHDSFNALK